MKFKKTVISCILLGALVSAASTFAGLPACKSDGSVPAKCEITAADSAEAVEYATCQTLKTKGSQTPIKVAHVTDQGGHNMPVDACCTHNSRTGNNYVAVDGSILNDAWTADQDWTAACNQI